MHTMFFTAVSLTVTCVLWMMTPSLCGPDR